MSEQSLELLAAQAAIKNMMLKGWVDICCIKDILKLLSIVPDSRPFNVLNTLHCVHFKDMPRALQEQIPALLRDVFGGLQLEVIEIEAPIAATDRKPTWWNKLLN